MDTAAYYAFLLDAIARFPNEGVKLHRSLLSRWGLAPTSKGNHRLLDCALEATKSRPGVVLEFGVFKGSSIRHMARRHQSVDFYGFDSFAGFPDDGRSDWKQDFSIDNKPKAPPNVTLIDGFFEESLPRFLRQKRVDGVLPLRFTHIDCDIYSSTKTVFDHLTELAQPGAVIGFDELLHYHRFEYHEFRAFYEFLEINNLDFKWVANMGDVLPLKEFFERRAVGDLPRKMQGYREQNFFQSAIVEVISRSVDYESRISQHDASARTLADKYPLTDAST